MLGIVGGLLVLALVAARGRIARPLAAALVLAAVLPFAALTWWSVVTPLLGLLLIAIGVPATVRRRASAPDVGEHRVQRADEHVPFPRRRRSPGRSEFELQRDLLARVAPRPRRAQ